VKFSTDPFNELNMARKEFHNARMYISDANAGLVTKSFAFRNFNSAKKRLADICSNARGIKPPKRQTADYDLVVCGIPCGAVITSYSPAYPAKLNALPEDCYPGEDAEVEFYIVDRRGYRAEWIMNKMSDRDWKYATSDILKEIEK